LIFPYDVIEGCHSSPLEKTLPLNLHPEPRKDESDDEEVQERGVKRREKETRVH
jgi:hypothetical protein